MPGGGIASLEGSEKILARLECARRLSVVVEELGAAELGILVDKISDGNAGIVDFAGAGEARLGKSGDECAEASKWGRVSSGAS